MKDYLKKIELFLSAEIDPAFARRAKIIFENLDLKGNEKLLEIGCGRGFYLKVLKSVWPDLSVTGIDLNPQYLKKAKGFMGKLRVNLRVADGTKLPFENKTFDRIIATEILEHIPDDQKAIAEMHRVLKPGGIIMVTVPNKDYPFLWDPLNWVLERVFNWHIPSNIWWLAGIWADHIRLYSEREIREKLGKAGKMGKMGFKIEKVWHATHFCFPFSHFLFYGIGKNLVEKGLFSNMNRFSSDQRQNMLRKILLFPVKTIDHLNDIFPSRTISMNLVVKLVK